MGIAAKPGKPAPRLRASSMVSNLVIRMLSQQHGF